MKQILHKNIIRLLPALLAFTTACTTPPQKQVHRSSTTNTYHGVTVADPYDWLEDLNAPETQAWIDAQNMRTEKHLNEIPQRSLINERLTELWDYEKIGSPWKVGDRYFQYRNDGLQNHHVLYTMDTLDGPARVLIDPNTFSDDGTVSLSSVSISEDGKWAAYAISKSGSDWREVYIRNVETNTDLEDHLEWIKFSSPSWDHASEGFYYGRYDPVDTNEQYKAVVNQQRLFYHRMGTSQEEDTLIFEKPDEPKWGFGAGETEDGTYVIMSVWKGSGNKNALFYRRCDEPAKAFTPLFDQFDASYDFIANDGAKFWIETNRDAPRGKVVAVDISQEPSSEWEEVIPEQDEPLKSATVIAEHFVCSYLKDARTQVRIHALDGNHERDLELPGIGTARGFKGKRNDTETFFSFSSFATPSQVHRYDFAREKSELFAKPEVDIDSENYITHQHFFTSKDGTNVPMFVSHKKGIVLDGSNPTLLYGYGGFNASLTPHFSVTRMVWMEMGGVYVVANIRGGGEYGEDWHQAGTKLNKQNVFDDFIAAAEWLIKKQITSPEKLAIDGSSNGGLLVGACLTQRPELFGAALPGVGVMDMLKYHTYTIGWAWASDYGTADDPAEFNALYAYSPYHNAHPANYPPTLVTTADTDDRVVPSHSYKFTAALQHAQRGAAPVLIRVDRKAGHGGGKPTTKIIEEQADRLAFLYKSLKMSNLEK